MKTMISSQNTSANLSQQHNADQNPAAKSYPPEASFANQTPAHQNNSAGNDLLPLLMSMLGKGGNPLADILSQNNKKEEENSSPNNEILL